MTAEQLEASLRAMQHLRDQWQLELDSARRWRAGEIAKAGGLGAPADAAGAEHERTAVLDDGRRARTAPEPRG